ncbi:MAG: type 4a pilus biogenesis protein PilO [Phycisphaerales bacterium]
MTKGGLKLWPMWRLDAGGLGVCAAITAGFYFGGLEPLDRARAVDAAGRDAADAVRMKADAARAQLRVAEQKLAQVRRAIAASPLRLAGSDHLNSRVAELSRLARDNGLEIDEIRPGTPAGEAWFTRVPIRIAGNGPYRACLLFLHGLHDVFPDTGLYAIELRGDPSPSDTPALFTFDLVWFAAPARTADATK